MGHRSIGQHQQADMLEQQTKAAKGGDASQGAQPQANQQPGPPGTTAPAAAPNGNAAAPAADFSLQWAEHYRSMGKIQEAEAIEAYIKAQKVEIIIYYSKKKIEERVLVCYTNYLLNFIHCNPS